MAETAPTVLEADLTWIDGAFHPGVQVMVGEGGRIIEVTGVRNVSDVSGVSGERSPHPDGTGPASTLRMRNCALLPGFVDVHSHAFQRGLRGLGESFPEGAGNFWTWRQAMYSLVERLDPTSFRALCVQAFREMRAAGITTVGEFHYVHHLDPDRLDWTFDGLVLEAAAEVGIRCVLLQTYYRTGGIGQPLEGGQRRFSVPSPALYWEQMDRLATQLDPRTQSLGAVVHSLRAGSPDDLAEIYDEARRRDLVFHIHVEEQRREIADALAFYGRHPMALLLATLGTATDITAVHCTHTSPEDLERFLAGGGTVCLCPLTEGNLGDGFPDLPRIHDLGGPFCFGGDSNARISMLENMRWLEYAQRLRSESRGVLREPRGEGRVAPGLLRAATESGARALGLEAGEIAPGLWADFTAIDLTAPELAGWTPETLPEALVFGAGNRVIAGTCVGGVWDRR
jgi:formimidoylglutamate deiminase